MTFLFYPLRYLRLRNESGGLLLWRDFIPVILIASVCSIPFWVFSLPSFFKASGFMDGIGSLASTLTGFYVAALIATATFATVIGDIDEPITKGPVVLRSDAGDKHLTRRQYVSNIFGYAAFLALILSIIATFGVALSGAVADALPSTIVHIIACVVIFAFTAMLGHMITTTGHGLYYLIDRLYHKPGTVVTKRDGSSAP